MTLAGASALALLAGCGGGNGKAEEGTVVARTGDATVRQGDNGATTVTTNEGTTQIRTGQPVANLPGGLPAYPTAQTAGGVDVTGAAAGGQGRVVMFTTSDQPAQVIDYYASAAGRLGLQTEARMTMGPTATLALRHGGQQVTVTAVGAEGGTQVQIASGG
jgi:hypothetical protein